MQSLHCLSILESEWISKMQKISSASKTYKQFYLLPTGFDANYLHITFGACRLRWKVKRNTFQNGTGYICSSMPTTSKNDTLKPHFCHFGPPGSPKSHDCCNVWPQNDSSTRSHVKHPCVTSLDRPPGPGIQ